MIIIPRFFSESITLYLIVPNKTSHGLICHIPRNNETAKHWLNSLQSSIPSQHQVLSHVTLMLSALLVTSEGYIAMETLKVIPILAKTDPSQVLINLLVLYMYVYLFFTN